MKRITWRKHHKWFGLLFCFFMLMFCWSGIVLNHREAVADINVSRKWLPAGYRFEAWNGGLLRGTLRYTDKDSVVHILAYGAAGVWRTDTAASAFVDFNEGLPQGADYRSMKGIVQTPDGTLYAAGQFGLYRHDGTAWIEIPLPLDEGERLSDITVRGDTLVVAGRSYLYLSTSPHAGFRKIQVKVPDGYEPKVTLFRTVWMLHSGELFGTAGKLVVDAVAVVLVLLCLTGLAYWLLPKDMRRRHRHGQHTEGEARWTRLTLLWHDKLGRTTIILTLLVAVTGWCLRPPVMIPLALTKTPALPGTSLDSPNPWHDKLRMVRYDDMCGDWLLSTSEGFYSLASPDAVPVKVEEAPPVSVMGLNVWQKDKQGNWLAGSFSGLFVWDRQQGRVTDYFTGEEAEDTAGPPFGKFAVSGYSADFKGKECVVEYYEGTDALAQPGELSTQPMSLWNFALEVHSGRVFIGSVATYVFVFLVGGGCVWCLWTGYRVRKGNKQ